MNIALIGCSARGHVLASAAAGLGHTVSVCVDASMTAARRLAAGFDATATQRALEAVSGVDAVLVSDPAPTDVAPALRALHAGLHVYWAAPLAADPKHARSMLDAAQAESAVLGVGYLGRACPQFDAAAAQASSGAVGKIGFVRVRRSTAAPKGPAHDAALESLLHDIDWVAANFGPVTVVFAQTVFRRPVNWALITLTLGKGPIVQGVAVAANDDDAPLHADIELCGESGMIQFRSRDPILTVTSQSANANRVRTGVSPLAPPIVSRRLARFFDAAGGRMPRRQLNHEMHIVRVFEALLESAREGRAVEIGS